MVIICTACFNTEYTLHYAHTVYFWFRMFLTTKSDYFPKLL
jgi:hypothetical protein